MKGFFQVKTLDEVMELIKGFSSVDTEKVPISRVSSRILAENIHADDDMPVFRRSTMDGYAVVSGSTFGASDSSPAWLDLKGSIAMGEIPEFDLKPGQAARISTGGMLPEGADSVVMIEHTEMVGDSSVEIYKSVAPLQHVIDRAEDFKKNIKVLEKGTFIRPQEAGLAAAFGLSSLKVFKKPKIAVISTGDEIVPVNCTPGIGKIRDINSYTLAGLIRDAGAVPVLYGIVKDDPEALFAACKKAVEETDMVLLSGGSSVGVRDFTVEVLSSIKDTEILVHGISISPGKPTILGRSGNKAVWGLPGHVSSAMVVFKIVVLPFIKRLKGCSDYSPAGVKIPVKLMRNIASAQGRQDFVRVRFVKKDKELFADPVLGKSGLIRTMVLADGLLEIGENQEGVEKNTIVEIIPM